MRENTKQFVISIALGLILYSPLESLLAVLLILTGFVLIRVLGPDVYQIRESLARLVKERGMS
ncbi:hypothetical protein ACERC8_09870 [Streptococcus sp. E29BA]|uniref:hypothetical protein n=1 Tax=Streptococcus sp. E29BA TaxID=3278716 RepID=UPI00359DA06A